MKNIEAKSKAIEKAYGDKWSLVKSLTPNRKDSNDAHDLYCNGSFNTKRLKLNMGSVHDLFSIDLFDFDGKWVTPKSIIGLHENNGWTRIEPDGSNLPKEFGDYKVLLKSGNTTTLSFHPSEDLTLTPFATHYKPIQPELKPIY